MKAYLALSAMLLLAISALSSQTDRKLSDEGFLRSYMGGEYDLIGRRADSTSAYNEHVTLRDEGGVLQVTELSKARARSALLNSML